MMVRKILLILTLVASGSMVAGKREDAQKALQNLDAEALKKLGSLADIKFQARIPSRYQGLTFYLMSGYRLKRDDQAVDTKLLETAKALTKSGYQYMQDPYSIEMGKCSINEDFLRDEIKASVESEELRESLLELFPRKKRYAASCGLEGLGDTLSDFVREPFE